VFPRPKKITSKKEGKEVLPLSLLDVGWDSSAGQGQKIIVFSRLFIEAKETGIENCNY